VGAERPAIADGGEAAPRDNGQRFGVRFRRGSRGPLRPGEIPLIGVVQIEAPEPVAATAVAEPEEEAPASKKPARRRSPRKKAAAAPATAEAPEAAEGAAPRPRRPRSRAKKKTE
jgi:ribonuclease E